MLTPTKSRSVTTTCDCTYTVDGCASSSMKISAGAALAVGGGVTRSATAFVCRAPTRTCGIANSPALFGISSKVQVVTSDARPFTMPMRFSLELASTSNCCLSVPSSGSPRTEPSARIVYVNDSLS